MSQLCSKCNTTKTHKEFPKNLKCNNGIEKQCKSCKSLYRKQHYIENKEHENKTSKTWELKNEDKIRDNKKKYYVKNKKRIVQRQGLYQKNKYNCDINYKMKCILRARLNRAINGNYKAGSAVSDLGCSIEELKIHIEVQFKPGMTWDNWSRTGWHIDHKKALANFDLTNREELLKACHHTNLKPMWAKDNISKGDTDDVEIC